MTRVQVTLSDEEVVALRERARKSGRPMTAMVREAVKAWLAAEERERLWDRALAGLGGFHSGLNDLAQNHDKYLNEGRRW